MRHDDDVNERGTNNVNNILSRSTTSTTSTRSKPYRLSQHISAPSTSPTDIRTRLGALNAAQQHSYHPSTTGSGLPAPRFRHPLDAKTPLGTEVDVRLQGDTLASWIMSPIARCLSGGWGFSFDRIWRSELQVCLRDEWWGVKSRCIDGQQIDEDATGPAGLQ
jgi:hypothetical protein